jgi:negative regulator of sigma E activity
MQRYEKVQRIADSITEVEYARYKNYFQLILNETGSEGFTVLKHLKKLPHPTVPGEFVYEYQLSDGLARFFVYMEQEFKGRNQDLKSAITLKVLDELYIKPMFTEK